MLLWSVLCVQFFYVEQGKKKYHVVPETYSDSRIMYSIYKYAKYFCITSMELLHAINKQLCGNGTLHSCGSDHTSLEKDSIHSLIKYLFNTYYV